MTTSAVRRRVACLTLTVSGLFLLVSCSTEPSPDLISFHGPTMGTSYKIRLAAGEREGNWPPDMNELQRQVDELLDRINRLMSTYDPNSELSRFNRSGSTEWFAVSAETARVVAEALAIAERTEGAFDPTVGPVVNLWGFGPDKSPTELPTEQQIQDALSRVGFRRVAVRSEPPALRKEIADVYLDLSGIAKGYASDEVSDLLEELGCQNSMVEIGGEVRTRGEKSGGNPWLIGVQTPDDDGNPIQMAVPLDNSGMATSGDYRNYFEYEGVRYSHTIDPDTGRPVKHDLASVSIVAHSCMEADALATAVLVMGDRPGYDWCDEAGVGALFLIREGDGIVERRTPEFMELVE